MDALRWFPSLSCAVAAGIDAGQQVLLNDVPLRVLAPLCAHPRSSNECAAAAVSIGDVSVRLALEGGLPTLQLRVEYAATAERDGLLSQAEAMQPLSSLPTPHSSAALRVKHCAFAFGRDVVSLLRDMLSAVGGTRPHTEGGGDSYCVRSRKGVASSTSPTSSALAPSQLRLAETTRNTSLGDVVRTCAAADVLVEGWLSTRNEAAGGGSDRLCVLHQPTTLKKASAEGRVDTRPIRRPLMNMLFVNEGASMVASSSLPGAAAISSTRAADPTAIAAFLSAVPDSTHVMHFAVTITLRGLLCESAVWAKQFTALCEGAVGGPTATAAIDSVRRDCLAPLARCLASCEAWWHSASREPVGGGGEGLTNDTAIMCGGRAPRRVLSIFFTNFHGAEFISLRTPFSAGPLSSSSSPLRALVLACYPSLASTPGVTVRQWAADAALPQLSEGADDAEDVPSSPPFHALDSRLPPPPPRCIVVSAIVPKDTAEALLLLTDEGARGVGNGMGTSEASSRPFEGPFVAADVGAAASLVAAIPTQFVTVPLLPLCLAEGSSLWRSEGSPSPMMGLSLSAGDVAPLLEETFAHFRRAADNRLRRAAKAARRRLSGGDPFAPLCRQPPVVAVRGGGLRAEAAGGDETTSVSAGRHPSSGAAVFSPALRRVLSGVRRVTAAAAKRPRRSDEEEEDEGSGSLDDLLTFGSGVGGDEGDGENDDGGTWASPAPRGGAHCEQRGPLSTSCSNAARDYGHGVALQASIGVGRGIVVPLLVVVHDDSYGRHAASPFGSPLLGRCGRSLQPNGSPLSPRPLTPPSLSPLLPFPSTLPDCDVGGTFSAAVASVVESGGGEGAIAAAQQRRHCCREAVRAVFSSLGFALPASFHEHRRTAALRVGTHVHAVGFGVGRATPSSVRSCAYGLNDIPAVGGTSVGEIAQSPQSPSSSLLCYGALNFGLSGASVRAESAAPSAAPPPPPSLPLLSSAGPSHSDDSGAARSLASVGRLLRSQSFHSDPNGWESTENSSHGGGANRGAIDRTRIAAGTRSVAPRWGGGSQTPLSIGSGVRNGGGNYQLDRAPHSPSPPSAPTMHHVDAQPKAPPKPRRTLLFPKSPAAEGAATATVTASPLTACANHIPSERTPSSFTVALAMPPAAVNNSTHTFSPQASSHIGGATSVGPTYAAATAANTNSSSSTAMVSSRRVLEQMQRFKAETLLAGAQSLMHQDGLGEATDAAYADGAFLPSHTSGDSARYLPKCQPSCLVIDATARSDARRSDGTDAAVPEGCLPQPSAFSYSLAGAKGLVAGGGEGQRALTRRDFSGAEVIGQWVRKFILVRLPSGADNNSMCSRGSDAHHIVAIDQHALHERVRLEAFLAGMEAFVSPHPVGADASASAGSSSGACEAACAVAFRPLLPVPTSSGRVPITMMGIPIPPDRAPSVLGAVRGLRHWGWRIVAGAAATVHVGMSGRSPSFVQFPPLFLTHVPVVAMEGHRYVLGGLGLLWDAVEDMRGCGAAAAGTVEGDCTPEPQIATSAARSRLPESGAYAFPIPRSVRSAAVLRSCRGAVMFGDALDHGACALLVGAVPLLDQFSVCSHGRVSMTPLTDVACTAEL